MGDMIEKLAKAHSRELFGYICRFVGNRAWAEDILGDVFVKLIENAGRSTNAQFSWRPWFYKVATRESISFLRKQKVRSMFLRTKATPSPNAPSPEDGVSGKQTGLMMRRAIEGLDHTHRAIIIMRVYEELSYEEIAAAFGIGVGTVKSRLHEARVRIRDAMEGVR